MGGQDQAEVEHGHVPLISIVIPSFNGRKWLQDCINSILRSDYPLHRIELIIVDNGSSDGSVESLQLPDSRAQIAPSFVVIRNQTNLGWSPANNQGFRRARGTVLVSVSNDVRPDPRWLQEIVRALPVDDHLRIVQCNCRSLADPTVLDSGLAFVDRFGFIYGYMPGPSPEPQDTFYAEGAAFALTRSTFEAIGGFDDSYFMQYDDVDLCWRARLRGAAVQFLPRSVALHARGGTVGGSMFNTWPMMLTLSTRNHLTTLFKNLGARNLATALPIAISFHLLKAVALGIMGEPGRARAVAAGVVEFVGGLDAAKLKRRSIQSSREVSDSELAPIVHRFSPGCLVKYLRYQQAAVRPFLRLEDVQLHGRRPP